MILKPLGADSEMIAKRLKETGRDKIKEEEFTSKEWVDRMALGRRGVGKWLYSGGKEMDIQRQGLKV